MWRSSMDHQVRAALSTHTADRHHAQLSALHGVGQSCCGHGTPWLTPFTPPGTARVSLSQDSLPRQRLLPSNGLKCAHLRMPCWFLRRHGQDDGCAGGDPAGGGARQPCAGCVCLQHCCRQPGGAPGSSSTQAQARQAGAPGSAAATGRRSWTDMRWSTGEGVESWCRV
jgi:hypothetical protein